MLHKRRVFLTAGLSLLGLVVGVMGFTVWFAYHSSQVADRALNDANKVARGEVPTFAPIKTFEDCKKARGSSILLTYPAQCMTTGGKTFTDTTQQDQASAGNQTGQCYTAGSKTLSSQGYLVIKEWGVKIPLSDADASAFYEFDEDSLQSAAYATVTICAKEVETIVGPTGASCKGEYVAHLTRMYKDDPRWAEADRYNEQKVTVGSYAYAIATHKQYGPDCFDTNAKDEAYIADKPTVAKFDTIVNAFKTDFAHIVAS